MLEAAGITNAVRWDVSLGAGYTCSSWVAMPQYRQREIKLPQTLRSGHQRAIRLVDFVLPDDPANHGNVGQSGVELRILLEPLGSAAIRTQPGETDRTTHIAGRGLAGTIEAALSQIKQMPLDL